MQITKSSLGSTQTGHPLFSADWNFLLSITPRTKLLVMGRDCSDYVGYFDQLGIETCAWEKDSFGPHEPNTTLAGFDIVALPQGLFDKKLMMNHSQLQGVFQNLKHIVKPGGTLLIGFANVFGFRRRLFRAGFYSHPHFVRQALLDAGFVTVELFGVISKLATPDYIFPLTEPTVSFVLEHRYANQLPASFLPYLHAPAVAKIISKFMPAYFAIAVAPSSS